MAISVCILLMTLVSTSFGTYSAKTLQYLEQFGYLPKVENGVAAMLSETLIEEAIRELQHYGNIPVTGKLDDATKQLMSRKRCGLPDRPINEYHHRHRRRHRKRYALSGFKWEKKTITFSVDNAPRTMRNIGMVRREVNEAMNAWQRAAAIRLNEVRSESNADMKITFMRGDHGDRYAFDGSGRILAHAFPPGEGLGGDIHLDDDERWSDALIGDARSEQVSLRSIVMHEIGHSLGLSHSLKQDSIMYSFYQADSPPQLYYDDIVAIQSLYGRGYASAPEAPRSPTVTTTTRAPPLVQTTTQPAKEKPKVPSVNEDRINEVPPDPCKSDIDAITEIRGEVFVFKGDWFWRIRHDGYLNEGPRKISSLWGSLPSPIDAVVEDHNDRILFFVGKKLYVYRGSAQESVRPLTAIGLPDYVRRIRLVYKWNYWTEKPIYIWTDEEFWRIDRKSGKVEIGYPRRINAAWHFIPQTANAAFTFRNDLYFFAGNEVFKFHSINMSAVSPQPSSKLWSFCPKAMKISSNAIHKSSFTFIPFHLLLYFVTLNFN